MGTLAIYLKHDLTQFLKNKNTKVLFALLTLLAILDTIYVYYCFINFNGDFSNTSASHHMFLESFNSIISGIYFFLVPIIASISFVPQYIKEKKNNYNLELIIRGTRFNYFFSKFLICFFSGFLSIFYFLILNYLIVLMTYPRSIQLTSSFIAPSQGSALKALFYQNLYGYQFVFIIINSVVGGLLALLGFVVSLLLKVKNEFIVIAVPFMIYTMQSILLFFVSPHHDLLHIIQPKTRYALSQPLTLTNIMTTFVFWVLMSILLFYLGYKKECEI